MKSPFILFILIFFFHCESKNNKKENTTSSTKNEILKPIGQKKISLDSLTSGVVGIHRFSYMSLGGKPVLIFANNQNASLYIYDYKENKLLQRIQIPSEGPKALGKQIEAYIVKSLDSLFIFPKLNRNIYLIDDKINHLKKYPTGSYTNDKNWETNDSIIISGTARFYLVDNYLYTHTAHMHKGDYFGKHPVMVRFNIKTSEREKLPLYHPERYQKEYFGVDVSSLITRWNFSAYNPKTEKFVHSFTIDENIYVADKDYKNIQKYEAKSNYIDKIKPFTKKEVQAKLNIIQKQSGMYYTITYDEYRDVYYREVRIPIQDAEKAEKSKFFEIDRSIIVLDNKFQKIGELKLPKEYGYNTTTAICTPDGLLLQRTVSSNEDELIFDIFDPLAQLKK